MKLIKNDVQRLEKMNKRYLKVFLFLYPVWIIFCFTVSEMFKYSNYVYDLINEYLDN